MTLQKLGIILATGALIAFAGTANAQEQKTLRLSMREAQDYAVEHNYTMQNASLEVKKGEYSRWQALASMLPQGKATFDYQNMCGYEMHMSGFSIPMDPNGNFAVNVSIALTGAQFVGVMLQDIANDMTDITVKQTELTTRSNVRKIYVSILVMEDIATLLDSSLANMLRLEKATQESVKAGASEQVAADKLSVQVAQIRSSISTNHRALEALYNSLILQLGADVNTRFELTTKVDDVLDLNYLAGLAIADFDIEHNYDYQLLQKNEELQKKNVTMAKMDYSPTVSLYYQYSKKIYFGDEGMNMTPPNMVGASVILPLFTSGQRIAKVNAAQIAYTEALNSKQQAEDGLRVQFNQAQYDLANALEAYQIQKENLEVTQRVFNNIAEKYKYGHASNLEVTNASTDIITAQRNYIQAVINVVTAEVGIETMLAK